MIKFRKQINTTYSDHEQLHDKANERRKKMIIKKRKTKCKKQEKGLK